MKSLSLVTARIVRENEQYKYKIVGKGEKYLVRHDENEDAGVKTLEYLTPFAKEPVKIEQITLLKPSVELVDNGDADFTFKVGIQFIQVDDNQKERKRSQTLYVRADDLQEAFDMSSVYLNDWLCDKAITSISRTGIIDVI
ncbi:MAG: DUF4494 family protein [Prevotellaceae bacterium]|jgi:hypothetical protein|nr:DUF4494 family protein [Prevotellaceae bacterium]